jgi:hypothetical protein
VNSLDFFDLEEYNGGNMRKNNYELRVEWSDLWGEYEYVLKDITAELECEKNSGEYPTKNIASLITTVGSGDREWAERIAKHYGIEVPKEPEV